MARSPHGRIEAGSTCWRWTWVLSEGACAEDLSQVGACTFFGGLPGACCPNLSTVETGTVCPDRVLSGPGPPVWPADDLKCSGPAVYGNPPRKGQAPAPLLALHRIPRLEGRRRSQSCCKCCFSLSLEDFLGSLAVLWPGIESLGESGLAVVQQCSGRYKATLCRDHSEGGRRPVCVCLLFSISLHAARRVMVAACHCPRGQQRFSNTPIT